MTTEEQIESFKKAYALLGLLPLQKEHKISEKSRLVHDLGISGDDFDELMDELSGLLPDVTIDADQIGHYIPKEIGSESYHVACLRGMFAQKVPFVASYHLTRINKPELTLAEFFKLVA